MLAGEFYLADDPEIAADRQRAAVLMERFNASSAGEPQRRTELLRELLGSLGEGVDVRPPLYCDYGYHISIGSGTFVNYNAVSVSE